MKKIGFVLPWYGLEIPGGAEAEARETIRHLHRAGIALEVLTTCVKEFHSDWNRNYYKSGLEILEGIPVRRFRVRRRNRSAFDRVNARLMQSLSVSMKEEEIFIREMIHSPAMIKYLISHQEDYAAWICMPYMFGTTYDIIKACPEKSILLPCFHDEAYFYLHCYQKCYSKAAGMIFNSSAERALTERYYDLSNIKSVIMGIGMETAISVSPEVFREKFRIPERFLIYAGRKDKGKNLDSLLSYFQEYKKRRPSELKLILIGGGERISAKDVIDLGFLEQQEKYHAFSAAELLCQPSRNESFSLVIMESWLCGRPVLVHEKCNVTKNFVCESDGGLYFQNYADFQGCVDYFLNHPEIAAMMGQNGRDYVRSHFDWPVIIEKYQAFFRSLTEKERK